jgi:hypothetical protein
MPLLQSPRRCNPVTNLPSGTARWHLPAERPTTVLFPDAELRLGPGKESSAAARPGDRREYAEESGNGRPRPPAQDWPGSPLALPAPPEVPVIRPFSKK